MVTAGNGNNNITVGNEREKGTEREKRTSLITIRQRYQ
jgi:hypothetical protein